MAQYESFFKTALSKYAHADITKRDILNVFSSFADLRPRQEDFVFNDGQRRTLVQLDGTIPVSYKGSTYNIPICIWLVDTHPYNPPMVYVKPTTTMQIKQGRNVDPNGKIDLPYLREWRYPNSDLLGMIQILTIVFGEEPPVYSRPQRPSQSPYSGQSSSPYPPSGGNMPMPIPGVGSQNTPYPPAASQYPASSTTGYPGSYPGQFSGYPQQSQGYPGYPATPGYPASSGYNSTPGSTSYTPYPTSTQNSYPQQTAPTTTTTATMSGNSTVTEEHLKASLLSAVEDKMKWRLKETFAQAQAEMDVLYKTEADLLKGKDKLEKMIRDLEKEKSEVESNKQLLKQKDTEVKETISRLESQDKLSIDEAVVTTAPLYRQLLETYAEEQALEDAIYYLGESLRKNVLDLDVFLKQVRELSRKQFMLRALIQRCREKAGLPPLA